MVLSWGLSCLVCWTLLRIGFCADHPCGNDRSGLVNRTQVGDGTRNVEMTCKTGGNSVDQGSVKWVRTNASKELQINSDASKYTLNSVELIIKNVTESDEGKYSCTYNTNSVPGDDEFCLEVVGHPVFDHINDTFSFTVGEAIEIPVKFVQMRIGHGDENFAVNRLELSRKVADEYKLGVTCRLNLEDGCIGLDFFENRANTTFDDSFNITFKIISANETDSGQYEIEAIVTGSVIPSATVGLSITLTELLSLNVTPPVITASSTVPPSSSVDNVSSPSPTPETSSSIPGVTSMSSLSPTSVMSSTNTQDIDESALVIAGGTIAALFLITVLVAIAIIVLYFLSKKSHLHKYFLQDKAQNGDIGTIAFSHIDPSTAGDSGGEQVVLDTRHNSTATHI